MTARQTSPLSVSTSSTGPAPDALRNQRFWPDLAGADCTQHVALTPPSSQGRRPIRPVLGSSILLKWGRVFDTGPMPNAFVPPEQYYAQLARVRQGAGALITFSDGRVVMYDVSYRDYLELPGGAVELGESPPAACARECREELGAEIAVGRLLVVDHQNDGGERGNSVMFVYDGGVVDESALNVVPTDEGRGVVLVDPPELGNVTIPRLANRIRHALAARDTGGVVEAVNGEPR